MKFVITLLLMLSSFIVKAQIQDSVVGDWHFKDIHKAAGVDSAVNNQLKSVFSNLKINLRKDNTYTADFLSQENGNWYYDPELRVITLISEKGEDKIKVIDITVTTLILELNRGKQIVFEKKLM